MAIIEINIPDALLAAVNQTCVNNKIGLNELVVANLMLFANNHKNDGKEFTYNAMMNDVRNNNNEIVDMTKSELKVINCLYTYRNAFVSVNVLADVIFTSNGSKGDKPSIYVIRNLIASIKRKTNSSFIICKNSHGYKLFLGDK